MNKTLTGVASLTFSCGPRAKACGQAGHHWPVALHLDYAGRLEGADFLGHAATGSSGPDIRGTIALARTPHDIGALLRHITLWPWRRSLALFHREILLAGTTFYPLIRSRQREYADDRSHDQRR